MNVFLACPLLTMTLVGITSSSGFKNSVNFVWLLKIVLATESNASILSTFGLVWAKVDSFAAFLTYTYYTEAFPDFLGSNFLVKAVFWACFIFSLTALSICSST
jgi:hypothetical protein